MFLSAARRVLTPLALAAICTAAGHAQFMKKNNVSISVGGFGQYSRSLDSDAVPVTYSYPITPGNNETTTIYPYRQAPTNSFGGVASLQIHPLPYVGLAFNYSFTHFNEWTQYAVAPNLGLNQLQSHAVPTDMLEYTGGYLFHPVKRRIKGIEPYVEIGGGYLDFRGRDGNGDSQFRGAGLFETGFELPAGNEHISFRAAARSLYYRSPNFDSTTLAVRDWRVTMEPTVSAVYRF
jgi:hypothetical protein